MKKVYFLMSVGLLTATFAGCGRGWPGWNCCLGRGLFYRAPQAQEECCDSYDEYETYYSDTSGEWVPVAPENLPPVPTEAPAKARGTSADA